MATSRIRGLAVAAALCVALAGCKEELYSDLDEAQANEMVAVLAAGGIEAGRSRDKDSVYAVLVEGSDVAAATTVLRADGLPRARFQSLGDVFSADGLVGSPFEQQARFLHAMNQELSHSVSSIHGIREARVLVTAPPQGRYEREAPPASASVVIQHEPGFDAAAHVSTIKTIVAHSLPNLDYDDVAVALFAAPGPELEVSSPRPQPSAADASALMALGRPGDLAAARPLVAAAAGLLLVAALFGALRNLGGGRGR